MDFVHGLQCVETCRAKNDKWIVAIAQIGTVVGFHSSFFPLIHPSFLLSWPKSHSLISEQDMPLHGGLSHSQQTGRIVYVWKLPFKEISRKIKCPINIPSPLLHLRFQIYSIPDVPLSPNCGHLYFQKQVFEPSGDCKVSIFNSTSFLSFNLISGAGVRAGRLQGVRTEFPSGVQVLSWG